MTDELLSATRADMHKICPTLVFTEKVCKIVFEIEVIVNFDQQQKSICQLVIRYWQVDINIAASLFV